MTRFKSGRDPSTWYSIMRSKDEPVGSGTDGTANTGVNRVMMDTEINQNELATLKDIARLGAFEKPLETTSGQLASILSTSDQTVLRRLQALDEDGLLNRDPNTEGHTISITDAGRRLLAREYVQYRGLFERHGELTLSGVVTEGAGEGEHFVSLDGYLEQFIDELGYEPYAGTLNLELDAVNVAKRAEFNRLDDIHIEGWESDGRSFGPVTCYPGMLETMIGTSYTPIHVLEPERTHHGRDQLELISDVRLRDELGLDTGEVIAVHVL